MLDVGYACEPGLASVRSGLRSPTSGNALPLSTSHLLEPGREVPEHGRSLDDPQGSEGAPPLEQLGAGLRDVVDVALRVHTPRDGQPHQLPRQARPALA